MTDDFRGLAVRADRTLGAALVEANLISVEQFQIANEAWLERVKAGTVPSLLQILVDEQAVLREEDLLLHGIETENLGVVDLRHFEISEDVRSRVPAAACRATSSIPFDEQDGVLCVASAYWLSRAVRDYWTAQHPGTIAWYGTVRSVIAELLEPQ